MLKDSGLLIEFWDEAIKADVYTRNRTFNGLKINGIRQTLIGAYIREMPNIDHLKPFGYKYYGYIDPKSLPANKRIDKLMMPGRLSVFIGYSKETIKQVKIYALDLRYIIKVIRVDFEEEILSGTIDLIIKGVKPQGTMTALP
jgi:hypothetical protein